MGCYETDVICYCDGGQSFAKNAGLYGERIGALHVVAPDTAAAARVKSQLSVLARSEISNPPAHGARLVSVFSPYRVDSVLMRLFGSHLLHCITHTRITDDWRVLHAFAPSDGLIR